MMVLPLWESARYWKSFSLIWSIDFAVHSGRVTSVTASRVEWGINSVSISPDMIAETRKIIADAEQRVARSQRMQKVLASAR